jgi:hypothetical protein
VQADKRKPGRGFHRDIGVTPQKLLQVAYRIAKDPQTDAADRTKALMECRMLLESIRVGAEPAEGQGGFTLDLETALRAEERLAEFRRQEAAAKEAARQEAYLKTRAAFESKLKDSPAEAWAIMDHFAKAGEAPKEPEKSRTEELVAIITEPVASEPVHKGLNSLQIEIAQAGRLNPEQQLVARRDWVDRQLRTNGEVQCGYQRCKQ